MCFDDFKGKKKSTKHTHVHCVREESNVGTEHSQNKALERLYLTIGSSVCKPFASTRLPLEPFELSIIHEMNTCVSSNDTFEAPTKHIHTSSKKRFRDLVMSSSNTLSFQKTPSLGHLVYNIELYASVSSSIVYSFTSTKSDAIRFVPISIVSFLHERSHPTTNSKCFKRQCGSSSSLFNTAAFHALPFSTT